MIDIFANVAVSGTNTYKSLVTRSADARCLYVVAPTGTLTGVLGREVNVLSDAEYEAAVAAAVGATRQAKEAAVTSGWIAQSLLQTDRPIGSTATYAISGTTPFLADMPACPLRTRLTYTNATNTGNLPVYLAQTPT